MANPILEFFKDRTIRKFWLIKLFWDFKGSYFDQSGWLKTFKNHKIVDGQNQEIPWVSYAAFKFLDENLQASAKIFEYGGGASTTYFVRKRCQVYTVEGEKKWYENISKLNLENLNLIYRDYANGYVDAVSEFKNIKYDIILIDGRRRVETFKIAYNYLDQGGVMILDDSERSDYATLFDFAESKEFKHIKFWGLANGSILHKCTTVFYKANNCLNI